MKKMGHQAGGQHTSGLLAAAAVIGALGMLAGPVQAAPVVDGDLLLGTTTSYTVKKHETLFDIARRYDMGIIELEAANPGVSPWNPKAGTSITVSTKHVIPSISHDGIVVNLSASRLFYFKSGKEVMSFPVANGKQGWETPVAATSVIDKRKHPTWTPPADIRAENPNLPESIPPGPGNPLGDYAMALGVGGIMIHGTNAPASIGKHASHGCIRMYPEDIQALFNAVPLHTPVLLTRSPYVMGWQGRTLYIEVTPRVQPAPRKSKVAKAPVKPRVDKALHEAVAEAAGGGTRIDWEAVDAALARADGIPTVVATRSLFVGPVAPPVTTAAIAAPAATLAVTASAASPGVTASAASPAVAAQPAAKMAIAPVSAAPATASAAMGPVMPAITPTPAAVTITPVVAPRAPAPVSAPRPEQRASLTLVND